MNTSLSESQRKSKMDFGEVYFLTNSIFKHIHLLSKNNLKEVIIDQLKWLKDKSLIRVYGLVIMPNHIHLLWEMLEKNGKETPYASLNKWTGNQFYKILNEEDLKYSLKFVQPTSQRNHRFWERKAVAKMIESYEQASNVLEYIHNNPLQEHWSLVEYPEDYRWSSAKFYETGKNDFDLFTHIQERF